jgi:hypothetical protein
VGDYITSKDPNKVAEAYEKNDKFIKKQEDITITERYTDAPQMIEVMSDGKYSEISLLFVFAKDCPYS